MKCICFLSLLPARLKGASFGKGCVMGMGYDFLAISMKGLRVGNNVAIGRRAWIQLAKGAQVTIGNGTNMGRDVVISCKGEVSIGEKCLFSYRVSVLDHDHNFNTDDVMSSGTTPAQPVRIESGCFVGAQSFILKGVTLGRNCVVGANSVVTKSYPANSIIVGNPARVVGTRVTER